MNFQKFLVTSPKPHCCGFAMHHAPKFVLLREPAIAFRLMGYTCQVCKRIGVSAQDIAHNTHRALRAAARVRPPADLFNTMKRESGQKQRGTTE